MHVNTKKTVEKTLDFYPWEDVSTWHVEGLNKVASREVYKKKGLRIRQVWHKTYRQVLFETPELTLSVLAGGQSGNTSSKKTVQHQILSIYTNNLEKNIYTSHVDDTGFYNETGKADMLFHFLEKIPDEFFVLSQDTKAVAHHRTPFKHTPCKTHIRLKD